MHVLMSNVIKGKSFSSSSINASVKRTASIACRAGEFLHGELTLTKEKTQTCEIVNSKAWCHKTEEQLRKPPFEILYPPDALPSSAELTKM